MMKSKRKFGPIKQKSLVDLQPAVCKQQGNITDSTALLQETIKLEIHGQIPTSQLVLFEDTHYDLGGDGGKVCSKCDVLLPLTAYSYHSGGNYLRPECRKCNNELSKVRQALRDKHGMPEGDYVCPICLYDEEAVKGKGNTKNGSWVLDHCHTTEAFRGWLCHKCNRSLGGFDDKVDTLERAIKYLKGN